MRGLQPLNAQTNSSDAFPLNVRVRALQTIAWPLGHSRPENAKPATPSLAPAVQIASVH